MLNRTGLIKVGMVGGGMMAQVGHLPFYLRSPFSAVAAVAESRPSLVAALPARFGVTCVVERHEELLADPAIDAVVICAPRPCTFPLALAALEAGKHVLAEKPVAHTVEQAAALRDAAKARGLIFAAAFMKRYDPGVQACKSALDGMVASGRLGRLLMARFYNFADKYARLPPPHQRPAESRPVRLPQAPTAPGWLPAEAVSGYAWFMNAISHDVNLMTYFLGRHLAVKTASRAGDDALTAILAAGDVPVSLEAARMASGTWVEGGEFIFERGRLSFAVPSPMAIEAVTEVRIEENVEAPIRGTVAAETGWSFARQAEGFVAALCGGPAPLTGEDEALADMVVCENIWRKIAEGCDD